MGSNSGLSGCYKSYTFGLSASQPIIGQGEYFELFASFINFSSMSPKDGCLDKIKCTFPDSVRNECGFVSCREKILLPVCVGPPVAKFQCSECRVPPSPGWEIGRAARAPLINTSDHVLQIQLCHFQFPNCPRGQHSTIAHWDWARTSVNS